MRRALGKACQPQKAALDALADGRRHRRRPTGREVGCMLSSEATAEAADLGAVAWTV